jgi:lantibiotic modifying enzyme
MNPEYLEIAERIGARLCRDALWSAGRCNWTGAYMDGDVVTYGSLGPEVYSGTSGIALFLWRLAAATGERIIRSTALGALRQALSKMPQPGCGVYAGGMGILFAESEIRGDSDEDAIVRQAATDRSKLDVIYGSAGCIGVLVHWHRKRGGSRFLDTASRHGDLLLSEAIPAAEGWSWDALPGARKLTGFSHGTAGIGWALLELWSITGEDRFRNAALEAFRYERSCFNPAERNWADLRIDPPSYPVVWCHGAGGIGFSRLRAWQILGNDELLEEARTALATVSESLDHSGNFSLCHGMAGNADLLIYASQVLREDRWLIAAQSAGQYGAEQYERKDMPWSCGLSTDHEVPGLMLGLAGIGYFYLRLADPASTPTVLLPGSTDGRAKPASSTPR